MAEIAFYGDDFTGSTDALLQFHRSGLRGVLLVERPDPAALRDLAGRYDVLGVAGIARSLPPARMDAEIRPVLEAFRAIAPRVVQYKICSTVDSSPRLGSLGRAIELGREVYGAAPVPVLAAQPELGRFTAFGHHFAAEDGTIHRLDRQPTMSSHPATPITESDLRLHLGAQTTLPVAGLDLTAYAGDLEDRYREILRTRPGAVVLDAVDDTQLAAAARTMLAVGNVARPGGALFALGSGGLSLGLARTLADRPEIGSASAGSAGRPVAVRQVFAVSGSRSARTRLQIETAVQQGWVAIAVDPTSVRPAAVGDQALAAFATGAPGVVVHTGGGTGSGSADQLVGAIGDALAALVKRVLADTGVRRIVVAGGDTSGRVLKATGVAAVEIAHAATGAPLCRALSTDPLVDGVELLLKGGQVGPPDLFDATRRMPTA